jgi:hypothetical protein
MRFVFLILLVISLQVSGQAPQAINYQGILRNASGQAIPNKQVKIRVSVSSNSVVDNSSVYTEEIATKTNEFGIYNVAIGKGKATKGNFASIAWGSNKYWVLIELDENLTNKFEFAGSMELASVPYALYAEKAKSVDNPIAGPAGPQGQQGPQGLQGLQGIKGDKGDAGAAGPVGLTGPAGATGATGTQGPIGLTGPAGVTGATGPQGPIGLTGPAGATGATGATGAQGPIGLTGPAGASGSAGPQGPIGLTGPAGATGATGPQGPIGLTGPTGATGPQGPIGLTGPAGATGATGAQGTTGLTGAAGPQGPAGATGAAGAQGPIGLTGPSGSNATITMGAIAGTSNVNGGTISSGVLTLAPADATNGGVISTGSQNLAGNKTFINDVTISGTLTNGNVTYPNIHGTANQVLTTTGSGTLTWTSGVSGSGGGGLEMKTFKIVGTNNWYASGGGGPSNNYHVFYSYDVLFNSPFPSSNVVALFRSNKNVSYSNLTASGVTFTADFYGYVNRWEDALNNNADIIVDALFVQTGEASGNNSSNTNTTHTIGENYGGGIVFFVTPDGKHGLIAAEQDQSVVSWPRVGVSWYEAPNYVPNPSNHNANGKKYTDWRLPSKYELNLLFINKVQIGNLTTDNYWSSTIANQYQAWWQNFGSGNQGFVDFHSDNGRVRAVRSF